MDFFYNGILPELLAGILIYSAGIFSSKLWSTINRENIEKKLKAKANTALDLIYEAEEKFVGHKMGGQRLEYVVAKYMQATGEKNYTKAQDEVMKVFSLTNLSK